MEDPASTRYWCHVCAQVVNPIREIEIEIKCPFCDGGFVEEMGDSTGETDPNFVSDRALSLWAPILLGMMGNPRRRRRSRRLEFDDEENDENDESRNDGETDLVQEIESIIRRRRRSSASMVQLLQGIRAGIGSESRNLDPDRAGQRDGDGEGERVILINPFNRTIILQRSSNDPTDNQNTIGSLGDYFIGPGLDLLLQHLAENDPNRYGTPPARKEAVEAMPTVKITDDSNVQCSVCLDEFNVGAEAKEMPCKHKFHSACILPWLDIHSSCPVCRYQMPADESKVDLDDVSRTGISRRRRDRERERERTSDVPAHGGNREEGNESGSNENGGLMEGDGVHRGRRDGDEDGRNENNRRFSFFWPFNGLFSSSTGSGNSRSTASDHESTSQREDS